MLPDKILQLIPSLGSSHDGEAAAAAAAIIRVLAGNGQDLHDLVNALRPLCGRPAQGSQKPRPKPRQSSRYETPVGQMINRLYYAQDELDFDEMIFISSMKRRLDLGKEISGPEFTRITEIDGRVN